MSGLGPVLLLVTCLVGLLLIPFGLPGLWLIVLAIIGYGWLSDYQHMSAWFLIVVIGLAALGEVAEARIGFSYARRFGGSSRAGWGALLGGLAGAIVGVPVPLIGSVIGGFVGAFVGAALFEYTRARQSDVAARAGWGAMLGRAMAAAVKMAIGVVLSVAALWVALRS
ncbi:MAG TPA: DUF456 domain-containing protein [Gemmatimonadales bacterium]|nr:DUF456 domain-containing protein [Gemmatimonadales bacterium]